uniref:Uncharacterized protein n=1 Tax=Dipterosiphonia australica TaxID=2007208 RepID=A0A1Z1MLJ9_9FLOR|nr:hypothetical protein [Dipterosiphonia australica]ARW66739.1 hypothetical protein [Dipterosiphonia australica]
MSGLKSSSNNLILLRYYFGFLSFSVIYIRLVIIKLS